MTRTRDWRRRQRFLHRGREKYTDWWHAYCRGDSYYQWRLARAERCRTEHFKEEYDNYLLGLR